MNELAAGLAALLSGVFERLWGLRCEIRKKLIACIRKHHSQSLPHLRTEIGGTGISPHPKP